MQSAWVSRMGPPVCKSDSMAVVIMGRQAVRKAPGFYGLAAVLFFLQFTCDSTTQPGAVS
jgi:hypothetical protein